MNPLRLTRYRGLVSSCVAAFFWAFIFRPVPRACAEDAAAFDITRPPGAAGQAAGAAGRQAAAALELRLPGDSSSVSLLVEKTSRQVVNLLGARSGPDSYAFQVDAVRSSDGSGRGVLVSAEDAQHSAPLVYGTFFRSGDQAALFEIRPQPGPVRPGRHEVVRFAPEEFSKVWPELGDDIAQRLLAAPAPQAQSGGQPESWHSLEVLVDASADFTQGRSERDVAAHTAVALAGANYFFEPLKVRLDLSALQLRWSDDPADPYREAQSRRDALGMLQAARDYWAERSEPRRSVVAALAASRFGNYFGLAYPGTACLLPKYACLFSTQGGLSSSRVIGLAATLAHEAGHVLGISHDSSGRSIMAPYYITSPEPFSDRSVAEFQAYAAAGGTGCLPVLENEPLPYSATPLAFRDGAALAVELREGQALSRRFAAAGGTGGFYYRAVGLPAGARLDGLTGDIFYAPGFDTADSAEPRRVFQVSVEVFSGNESAALTLELTVLDFNRPPEIYTWHPDRITAEAGTTLTLGAAAFDPDTGDFPVLRFANKQDLQRLPGRVKLSASGGASLLEWRLPSRISADVPVVLEAQDGGGLLTTRVLHVQAVPANKPPQLTVGYAPGSGGAPTLALNAADPEGGHVTLDVLGLPAGSIVRRGPAAAVIECAAAQGEAEAVLSDGVRTVRRTLSLAGGRCGKPEWPGSSSLKTGAEAPALLYDPKTGIWQELNCAGRLQERGQYGGFIGDLALSFSGGQGVEEVLYRTVLGRGFWLRPGSRASAWGRPGDFPLLGDADGDGAADQALYSPAESHWHMNLSSKPPAMAMDPDFGPETLPLRYPFLADIDGDRVDDRVFFLRKSDGAAAFEAQLAAGGDVLFIAARPPMETAAYPLYGDFDGDARTDLAVAAGEELSVFSSSAASVRVLKVPAMKGAESVVAGCRGRAEILSFTAKRHNITRVVLDENGLWAQEQASAASLPDKALTPLRQQMSRLRSLRRVYGDTNDDGKADFIVWRSEGNGFGRFYERSRTAAGLSYAPMPFSGGGAVVGFFGTDEGSQPAYFSGGWWTMFSSHGSVSSIRFGEPGDIPAAGDYNGDGRTDMALFRPESGLWIILYSGTQTVSVSAWGRYGDVPVPADYDGDAMTDRAVWRPSTGEWFIVAADGTVAVKPLGRKGDLPLAGDYNGDGTVEPAVWRPSNGTWYILERDGQEPAGIQWGLPGDIPVRLDLNGDGRVELVAFRPAEGRWYIRTLDSLATEIAIENFGLPTDIPLGASEIIRLAEK